MKFQYNTLEVLQRFLEIGNVRILTDPTFDPKGTSYDTGLYVLQKTSDPAIPLHDLGKINYVLLTHDHHFDNLDRSGRTLLNQVEPILQLQSEQKD